MYASLLINKSSQIHSVFNFGTSALKLQDKQVKQLAYSKAKIYLLF